MRADGRPSLSTQQIRLIVQNCEKKSAPICSGGSVSYLVAVARHIALDSPISGHLVASSDQFPNCLMGSRDTS